MYVIPMLDDVRLRVRKETSNDAANISGSKVAWVVSLTSSNCLYSSCPDGNKGGKKGGHGRSEGEVRARENKGA